MLGDEPDDSLGWRFRRPNFRKIFSSIARIFKAPSRGGGDEAAQPVGPDGKPQKAGPSGSGLFDTYGVRTKASDFSIMPGITNPEAAAPVNAVKAVMEMGEDLAGFSFRRAIKPPRRLRRMLKPPMAMRKGLRYAGAAAFTAMPFGSLMGRQRNKMFGLKGGEQKTFDTAAKVARGLQIAAVTVAGGAAIAPMLGFGSAGAMSSAASAAGGGPLMGEGMGGILSTGAGAAPGSFSVATAGTGVGQVISGGLLASLGGGLSKGASFLMKQAGSDAVWSVVKSVGQDWVASKFDKKQVNPADYAALPDNTLIPVGLTQGGGGNGGGSSGSAGGWGGSGEDGTPDPGMAPTVAGTGSMAPGGDSYDPADISANLLAVTAEDREANSADNPLGWKRDLLTPEPSPAEESQSDADFMSMVKGQGPSQAPEVAPSDNPAAERAPAPTPAPIAAMLEPDPTLEADDFDKALGVVREMDDAAKLLTRKSDRNKGLSWRRRAAPSRKTRRPAGVSDALWGVISC
jgi:hypothetical protein